MRTCGAVGTPRSGRAPPPASASSPATQEHPCERSPARSIICKRPWPSVGKSADTSSARGRARAPGNPQPRPARSPHCRSTSLNAQTQRRDCEASANPLRVTFCKNQGPWKLQNAEKVCWPSNQRQTRRNNCVKPKANVRRNERAAHSRRRHRRLHSPKTSHLSPSLSRQREVQIALVTIP